MPSQRTPRGKSPSPPPPRPSKPTTGGAASPSAHRIASARIAADLEAFHQAGGQIEVLAITRARDAKDEAVGAADPAPDAADPPETAK